MKTYKVIGRSPTLGHQPGQTFEADLNEKQEARLLQRGSLEVVTKPTTSAPDSSSGGGKSPGTPPAGKE